MTEAKIADACGRIRSRDDAAVVVTAAVASERERCARIAERCYKHSYQGLVVQTQRLIAAAIRNENRPMNLADLCNPMAEVMSDKARLDSFVTAGLEAVEEIERLREVERRYIEMKTAAQSAANSG